MMPWSDASELLEGVLSGRVSWHSPWALGLLVIPAAALVWSWRRRDRRTGLTLPMHDGSERLPRTIRQRVLWLPGVLRACALALVIVALARPQLGEGRVISSTDAVAIKLVVDRSGSMGLPMEIDGRETSRLPAAKSVLKEFLLGNGRELAGRPNDLIGVVQFAGFADTVAPLIHDHVALQELVESIPLAQHRYENGTAIGDAIALAAARLRTAEQDLSGRERTLDGEDVRIQSKAIILLTDGDNNAGEHDPQKAAALAGEWGIKVYAIGIGSDSYRTINDPILGRRRIPIQSELNENLLRAIAEASGGRYWIASDGATLREIYAEIDRLEKSRIQTLEYTDYRELFGVPALVACLLLAAQQILVATVLRRVP